MARTTARKLGIAGIAVVGAAELFAATYSVDLFRDANLGSKHYLAEATSYLAKELRTDDKALVHEVSVYNGMPVSAVISQSAQAASDAVNNLFNASQVTTSFKDNSEALQKALRTHGLGKAESIFNTNENEAADFLLYGIVVNVAAMLTVSGIVLYTRRPWRSETEGKSAPAVST